MLPREILVSDHNKVVSILLLLKEAIAIVIGCTLIAGALMYHGQRYEVTVGPGSIIYRIDTHSGKVSACTLDVQTASQGIIGHDWQLYMYDVRKGGYHDIEIKEYLKEKEGGDMMCSPWSAAIIRARSPKQILDGEPKSEPTQPATDAERKSTEQPEDKSH